MLARDGLFPFFGAFPPASFFLLFGSYPSPPFPIGSVTFELAHAFFSGLASLSGRYVWLFVSLRACFGLNRTDVPALCSFFPGVHDVLGPIARPALAPFIRCPLMSQSVTNRDLCFLILPSVIPLFRVLLQFSLSSTSNFPPFSPLIFPPPPNTYEDFPFLPLSSGMPSTRDNTSFPSPTSPVKKCPHVLPPRFLVLLSPYRGFFGKGLVAVPPHRPLKAPQEGPERIFVPVEPARLPWSSPMKAMKDICTRPTPSWNHRFPPSLRALYPLPLSPHCAPSFQRKHCKTATFYVPPLFSSWATAHFPPPVSPFSNHRAL